MRPSLAVSTLCAATACLASALGAAAAPQTSARPTSRAATAPKKPLPPFSQINLTATLPEPRRAQIRLALFIKAVQAKDWRRAVSYLSARVGTADRQRMLTGEGLYPRSRDDFARLLHLPKLEIRTVAFTATRGRFRMLSAQQRSDRGTPFGFVDFWMERENNRWMVNYRPPARRASAR